MRYVWGWEREKMSLDRGKEGVEKEENEPEQLVMFRREMIIRNTTLLKIHPNFYPKQLAFEVIPLSFDFSHYLLSSRLS